MTRLAPRAALLLLLLIPGCGAISAISDAGQPLDAYEIRPAPLPFTANRSLPRDVVVEEPVARGAIDTDRILIRPSPLQAQYLPGARWADTAPQLMQTLILRSLEDSGALRYAGRRPLGSAGDIALVTELTDFQADLNPDGNSGTVRIRLSARMVREMDSSIQASRIFDTSAQLASTETLDVVAAFDAAAARLLPELSAWVVQGVGASISPVAQVAAQP